MHTGAVPVVCGNGLSMHVHICEVVYASVCVQVCTACA